MIPRSFNARQTLHLTAVLLSTAALASPLPVLAQAYGRSASYSRLAGSPIHQAELGPPTSGQTVSVDLSGAEAPTRALALPKGKSAVIDLPTDARDVVLSDPKVAEVVMSTPRHIYVVGMASGQTDAAFMDAGGRQILRLNIRVDQDVAALGDTLNRLIPGSAIRVEPVNDSIVLSGEVENASSASKAVRLASAFVTKPEQVINMLSVTESEQVMLKVRVVEVNRSIVKQLGVNLNALLGTVGTTSLSVASAATYSINGSLLGGIGGTVTGGTPNAEHGVKSVSSTLSAFERTGLVRSLAEPDLTVVSGESGHYLVGGEFPVPVGEDNTGRVTLDFKQYGVGLGYTPIVLSKGRISLKLSAEVSELTNTGAFTLSGSSTSSTGVTTTVPSLVVPGLNVRRVETTVEIPSGKSLMIAGLLQSNAKQTVDSVPGVKDLPILGALFRSRDYLNDETELVVIITPYLVEPTNPNQMQTPADGLELASDLETNLLGRLNESFGKPAAPPKGTAYQGPVGYVVD